MDKINVKNLALADLGASETHEVVGDLSDVELPEEVKVKLVRGKIKLTRLEETILVGAQFEAEIELQCSRCLESTEKKINFDFDREYELDRKAISEEGLYVDKYLNINITEPVREELILAIPTKVLCSEECKGICQNCGVNLNKETCKCK